MAKVSRKKKGVVHLAAERRPFRLKETPLQDAMDSQRIGNAVLAAIREPVSVNPVPMNAINPTLVDRVRQAKHVEPARLLPADVVDAVPEPKLTVVQEVPSPAEPAAFMVLDTTRPWLEYEVMRRPQSTAHVAQVSADGTRTLMGCISVPYHMMSVVQRQVHPTA